MCRGFESLLRYHQSPHPFDAIGIGTFAKDRIQASCNLDFDRARFGGIAVDRDRFDEFPYGFRAFPIARTDAFRECIFQIFELLFVALQDGGMQRNYLEGRWGFCQFCKNRLALMVKFRRTGTDHIWIADALSEMIDKPVDLALELFGPALKPSSIGIGLRR
ncbi:MAG: hypothetical protein ABJG86_20650 [Nitratireductor sp.]|uniref:hypothetical protein n=1 Tax=Parasphingorhabdus sp. TaxID=2709688 RepID=UPI0032712D1A